LIAGLALALSLAWLAAAGPRAARAEAAGAGQTETGPADAAPLVIYSAQTATTAQLPLLAALAGGWPGPGRTVEIRYWKSLDDLRSLALAGQGDIWVGHVEALARAAARGAPVGLASVTAWRKFYLISAPLPFPDGTRHPADAGELLDLAVSASIPVASAPRNSPMAKLLEALVGPALSAVSLAPQQLALELARGDRLIGLMPEPMATAAALKNPNLRIAGSLEAEYARRLGGPDRRPQAAVAVNLALAEKEPGLVRDLIGRMAAGAEALAAMEPAEAARFLPEEARRALGGETLERSLALEPIMAPPAAAVRVELEDFLRLAAPELFGPEGSTIPDTFVIPFGPAPAP
jgi:NitT/TauT family transport system substrate-binding protein